MKSNIFKGIDLDALILEATREALGTGSNDEEREQIKKAAELRPFHTTKKPKKDQVIGTDVDEAEKDASELRDPIKAKKSELPEITLTRIIDKLNSIRAGNSLKDDSVKRSLNDYFTRLNGNERIALYAFLTGLDKIMGSPDEARVGDKVVTPHRSPYNVKMKKDSPKVDKKPAKGEESPIVVGESANKRREKLILARNRG